MTDHDEPLASITDRLERLERAIEERGTKKDAWDKLSAISTLFSGVIIAGLGLYATSVYNERQLEATSAQKARELAALELQTVETFFDHLSSRDPGLRKSSLEAIASLGDVDLAMQLAANLGGTGGEAFLQDLALTSDSTTRTEAEHLLNDIKQARIQNLDLELSHRLRFLRDLIHDGEINDRIMSELQTVFEQTPPGEQDYMVGGSVFLFEEHAGKNLVTVFDELHRIAPQTRADEIRGAKEAVATFQTMMLSAPTREVALAEHIVDSVPAFDAAQIEQIRTLIDRFRPWLEDRDA